MQEQVKEKLSTVNPPSYIVVLVTTETHDQARTIAGTLVQEKLAACVSITVTESVYTWQAKLQQQQEWQLVIKTHLSLYLSLAKRIQELHTYEIPELIALPIVAGSPSYLDWMGEQLDLAVSESSPDSN